MGLVRVGQGRTGVGTPFPKPCAEVRFLPGAPTRSVVEPGFLCRPVDSATKLEVGTVLTRTHKGKVAKATVAEVDGTVGLLVGRRFYRSPSTAGRSDGTIETVIGPS